MEKLTAKNFKKATIIVTLDDERHIITSTKDQSVFDVIAMFCQFALLNEDLVGEINVDEIIKKEDNK